jgi:hypothetical protein
MNAVKGTPLKAKQVATESSMVSQALLDMEDQLAIDPSLTAELKAKGLAHRWINGVKHKSNFGYDSRSWTPYKREKTNGLETISAYGYADSEGFIRRGDLVLAVRPQAIQDAVKTKNINKNNALAGDHKKMSVEQMKQTFRDGGISKSSKILDDYDDE